MSTEAWYARLRGAAALERPFLVTQEQEHSYREAVEAIHALSGWLAAEEITPAERLGLASTDSFAVAICAAAALLNGVTVVLLPPEPGGEKLMRRARAHACRAILLDEAGAPCFKRLATTPLRHIMPAPKALALDQVLRQASAQPPTLSATETTTAAILFTSGATGAPKGVRWSHGALFKHLETYQRELRYEPAMALFNGLPLHHTDGFFHGPLICLWCGMTWVRPPRFLFAALGEWTSLMQRTRSDILVAVPTLLDMIVRAGPGEIEEEMARLELIVSSAELLSPALWRTLKQRFAPVANIYGMSETVNGGLFALPWESSDVETVGRPIDMEADVRDREGRSLPVGQPGLLHLKGPNLFSGYVSAAGKFEPAALDNGWFCTADLAIETVDGRYRILGRADEARNVGGVLVHPAGIDAAVSRLPQVEQTKTLMLSPPESVGEAWPVTFVASKRPMTLEQLRRELADILPAAHMPRALVPVDALPVTETGKVSTEALRRLYDQQNSDATPNAAPAALEAQVITIAARVLGLPEASLSISQAQETTIGWDSFGHVNLALALERHFAVRFSYREVTGAKTLADFAASIRAKLHPSSSAG